MHSDTATVYRNEAAIGSSLKRIFEQNLIPGLTRQDIFLISKLAPKDQGYESCYQAVTESLRNLQVEYIDLYLIHWPGTAKLKLPDPQNAINRMESWRALEDLYHAKRLRAIGVSNYTLAHLAQLIERLHHNSHTSSHHPRSSQHGDASSISTPAIARTMVIPHVHQFEMHPRLFQKSLVDYCQHHRIQVQAYSSLGESRLVSLTPPPPPVMDSNYNTAPLPGALDIMPALICKYFPVPALVAANNASIDATADGLVSATAEIEYPKRAAQILLRWGLQHGAVVIPKSTHPERIRNNIDLFSFEIDPQDMAAMDAYSVEGERTRYCWDSTDVF
ncbi:hypothetical protein BGZ95_003336 [Linnemannia exigua]|uniref:NADP-dependent oxidoreductase domain-containing protein n=1 Tax=Linnemannia exigua TaxID=604196 RepID=A0AAD4D4T0_9FUNG|nr:hypothetical protein BGZ95_003336 [Linnemannia exigua]